MTVRPAIANVVKHQLMWSETVADDPDWYVTTIHVEHSGAITDAMVLADQTVFRDWTYNYWRDVAAPGVRLRELKAWDLSTVPPTKKTTDVVYPGSDLVGMAGAGRLPPQAAPVLSARTGVDGYVHPKPPSSRVFHVGGAAFLGGDGQITAGYANQLLTAYRALLAAFDFTGDRGRWVLVSYWAGGTRAAPVLRTPPVALPITHISMFNAPGTAPTRRRRQPPFLHN